MLIDLPPLRNDEWMTRLLAVTRKAHLIMSPIRRGVYYADWWDFEQYYPRGCIEEFPDIPGHNALSGNWICAFGICDSPEQFMTKIGDTLEARDEKYHVAMRFCCKGDPRTTTGWRWKKHGPYIGTQNHQCEHFDDEPEIKEVWMYHIYRVKES